MLDTADPRMVNSHYCLIATLEGASADVRNDVVARINAAGVGTSIYYPQPVPRMAYYRGKYGYDSSRFPGAEAVSDASLALPVGPHLESDDIQAVAAAVVSVVREVMA